MMKHCDICQELLKFSEKYDSSYCEGCNEWNENKCRDEKCFYCKNRPIKPIQTKDVMDKQIKKVKKDIEKKDTKKGEKDVSKLPKMDKKQDKKLAACGEKMKKK